MSPLLVKHKRTILPVLFALTLIAAYRVNDLDKELVTTKAPKGIASLEFAYTTQKAHAIVDSWTTDEKARKIDIAKGTIYRDYTFIACYCALLAFVVFIRKPPKTSIITIRQISSDQWRRLFLILIPVIAVLDVTENVAMTIFIANSALSPKLFSIPAYIKFALLGFVAIHLIKFEYLAKILRTLRLYIFGLASVALIFWLLINLTQGRDVIMLIGEKLWPCIWAIIAAFLWAFYSWYSSRLVGYAKLMETDHIIPPSYHDHLPRIIAFNAFVSLQAAILSLPTMYALTEVQLWTFVLFQNMLYFLFYDAVTGRPEKVAYITIIIVACVAYILVAADKFDPGGKIAHLRILPLIAFVFFVLQFVMVYWFVRRGPKTSVNAALADNDQAKQEPLVVIFNRVLVTVPEAVFEKEQRFFPIFNAVALIGFIFYALGFWLYVANSMGPLTATLMSFGILIGIANFVTVVSLRTKTNIFFYLFVIAIVVGRLYDPYTVRIVEGSLTARPYDQRPALDDYFRKWLSARDPLIKQYLKDNREFPVYLVIADGGASRSGYWVASVLSSLQDESIRQGNDKFSDHLFALAGASGGSVGNATFYALLTDSAKNDKTFLQRSRAFLKNDFLTPIIMCWFGTDVLQHIVPLGIHDRATSLEKAMEQFDSAKRFSERFSQIADTTGKLPVMFINVTNVQQGTPAVVSTIKIQSFSSRIDVLDSVASLTDDRNSEIRYSTAVVLGARFPYVSPGGSIGNESYVDGGYFDNTGAGIVHEMMQELDNLMKGMQRDTVLLKADPSLKAYRDSVLVKLKFKVIYLSNGPNEVAEAAVLHPLLNDAATPVLTVLGTYATQTEVNNKRLKNFMDRNVGADTFVEFDLYRKHDDTHYPMNWVISRYGLDNMDRRLEEIRQDTTFSALVHR